MKLLAREIPSSLRCWLFLFLIASMTSACATGKPYQRAEHEAIEVSGASVVSKSSVPPRVLGGGLAEVQILLNKSNGLSSAALSHVIAAEGWSVPEHQHQEADEILFILEGGGELTLKGKKIETKAGDAVFIPRSSLHSFIAGPQGIKALQVYAPGGPEQRFLKAPLKAAD